MKDIVKYLVVLLNIPTENNAIIVKDMIAEISLLKDAIAFVGYAKQRYSHYSLQYQSSYQKFLTLINEYKEVEAEQNFLERNMETIERSKIAAAGVVKKIYAANFNPEQFTAQEQKELMENNFFTEIEKKILSCIYGLDLQNCVFLTRSLHDFELYELLVERYTGLLREHEANKAVKLKFQKSRNELNEYQNLLEKLNLKQIAKDINEQ